MNYLLDSNTLSDFYNSDAPCHDPILNQFAHFSENDRVYVSVLSLYELSYGLANAPEDKKELVCKQILQTQRALSAFRGCADRFWFCIGCAVDRTTRLFIRHILLCRFDDFPAASA